MDYDIAEQKVKEIISESDPSRLLQNCIGYLYEKFTKYSWAGIYIVKGNNLVLGPWKGKQATEHTKIPIGKGICGHAACFVSTRSEIVAPIKKNGKIVGEIDIDSDIPNAFDSKDAVFLEKIADMLAKHI